LSPKRNNQTSLPRLIVISAPSGAGKTTLCEMLLKEFSSSITLSISTTTRPRRHYETEGVHYHFVSKDEFCRQADRGDFAEWAEVHGNLYGTLKATIDTNLAKGQHILFDIDVQGAMSLLEHYPDRVLSIFIHPPSLVILEDRLRKRQSESGTSIETRLQNAYNELGWSQKFDYQILNDDLQKAYTKLKTLVEKECL